MKKLVYLFLIIFLTFQALNAQIEPASVCTSPATYSFDQEVTWYFDLSGNTMVSPGENLYLWSWEPNELPGGRALLTYEGNFVWSLTFVPTVLYATTLQAIVDAGNTAFWSTILNEQGASVTSTIPYPLKEQLRLGNACAEQAISYRSYYLDFGPDDVTNGNITLNPDDNGNFWNNPTENTTSAAPLYLVDSENNSSDISLNVVSELWKNGIQNGGLLAPEALLLGDLAIATATQDYFFQTSKGAIRLEGLDQDKGYVFQMFASRNSESVRITEYTFEGATLVIDSLQSSGTDIGGTGYHGNNSNILISRPVIPDEYGRIKISIAVAEGGFAYLNAMKIVEVDPVPSMYIDFGPNDVSNGNITVSPDKNGSHWNNVSNPIPSPDSILLVDRFDFPTNAYLKVRSTFQMNGIQNGGLLDPDSLQLGDFAIATATQDYFFTTSSSSLDIGGLDTSSSYVFSFFGTRNSTSTRVTSYTLTGSTVYTGNHQTSGTDLGGTGYNGNNSTILVSDTISPDEEGMISLEVAVSEGGFAYLGVLKIEELMKNIEPLPLCEEKDSLLIAVMGSSVAYGYGATDNMGYAYQYDELLTERYDNGIGDQWSTNNISIGGNNTVAVMNRFEDDLLTLCGRYVIYGLSLGNEGIHDQGQPMYDQFRDNMLMLIDMARIEGIEPVVVNCYARSDFNGADYTFTKDMNLLIHQWDVASVNVLGAVDNGAGQWATGYFADPSHPNSAGHKEMFHTMVPSLFDAINDGKPQPEKVDATWITIEQPASETQIEIIPEDTIHPFTFSFDVKTTGSGVIGGYVDNDKFGKLTIDAETGAVVYASTASAGMKGSTAINDGQWHKITLTHYYAWGKTFLYVNDVQQGSVDEKLELEKFFLSNSRAPEADYRELYFYRSAMSADEISALAAGEMLKSSLEIYAPLDGQGIHGADSLVNLAQSTNTVHIVDEYLIPISDDATLSAFYVDGTPVPGFAAGTLTYNIDLSAGTSSVNLSATTSDANATLTGAGSVDVSSGNGTATIVVTAEDGTTSVSYTINFTVSVGVEASRMDMVQIYPNPATSKINVRNAEGARISIYELNGSLLKVMTDIPGNCEIDLNGISGGIYLIKIQLDDYQKISKFIKE